jgi:hypothetical protein
VTRECGAQWPDGRKMAGDFFLLNQVLSYVSGHPAILAMMLGSLTRARAFYPTQRERGARCVTGAHLMARVAGWPETQLSIAEISGYGPAKVRPFWPFAAGRRRWWRHSGSERRATGHQSCRGQMIRGKWSHGSTVRGSERSHPRFARSDQEQSGWELPQVERRWGPPTHQ